MNAIREDTLMQIKLVATDLDGTLLRDDRTISPRTRETLARVLASGVKLVLVTARPPRFVRELARSLDLTGTALCCNGAIVYNILTNELLEHTPIPSADAIALIRSLRDAAPSITFATESGHTFGQEPAYRALSEYTIPVVTFGVRVADAEVLCSQPVSKLIARHPTRLAADIYPLALGITSGRAEVTYSSERYLEFSAPGVDKARSLARYCQTLGITQAEVIAFGDMPNDVAMLRWAGHGVAVANAHPDTLAAARSVTTSNMDDGVARMLEQVLSL